MKEFIIVTAAVAIGGIIAIGAVDAYKKHCSEFFKVCVFKTP